MAKGFDPVSRDDVRAIFAYKLDELTTDLVRCDIVTDAADSEQIRIVHEELPGFDIAMKSFESLPGVIGSGGTQCFSHLSPQTGPLSTSDPPIPDPFRFGLCSSARRS